MIACSQAGPEDLRIVMAILDEAACWLERRGLMQWPCPHPPHFWERVGQSIELGEAFIARFYEGAESIGTLSLTWSDSYWIDRPRNTADVWTAWQPITGYAAITNPMDSRGSPKSPTEITRPLCTK